MNICTIASFLKEKQQQYDFKNDCQAHAEGLAVSSLDSQFTDDVLFHLRTRKQLLFLKPLRGLPEQKAIWHSDDACKLRSRTGPGIEYMKQDKLPFPAGFGSGEIVLSISSM